MSEAYPTKPILSLVLFDAQRPVVTYLTVHATSGYLDPQCRPLLAVGVRRQKQSEARWPQVDVKGKTTVASTNENLHRPSDWAWFG